MGIFKNWRKNREAADTPQTERATMQTGSYRQRVTDVSEAPPRKPPAEPELVNIDPHFHGSVETVGPGKNVFTPKRYVREDSGTHETLKIIDDSLSEDDEVSFDPYNTGQYDLTDNWHLRARK
jgi:hypothetical protein